MLCDQLEDSDFRYPQDEVEEWRDDEACIWGDICTEHGNLYNGTETSWQHFLVWEANAHLRPVWRNSSNTEVSQDRNN